MLSGLFVGLPDWLVVLIDGVEFEPFASETLDHFPILGGVPKFNLGQACIETSHIVSYLVQHLKRFQSAFRLCV